MSIHGSNAPTRVIGDFICDAIVDPDMQVEMDQALPRMAIAAQHQRDPSRPWDPVVLTVEEGELKSGAGSDSALRDRVLQIVNEQSPMVILNLANVFSLDIHEAAQLESLRRAVQQKEGLLRFTKVGPAVLPTLSTLKLDQYVVEVQ